MPLLGRESIRLSKLCNGNAGNVLKGGQMLEDALDCQTILVIVAEQRLHKVTFLGRFPFVPPDNAVDPRSHWPRPFKPEKGGDILESVAVDREKDVGADRCMDIEEPGMDHDRPRHIAAASLG